MGRDATDDALSHAVAERLREARVELAERWLTRITERVSLSPDRVFPTDALLDHVPLLILGIAEFVEDPTRTVVADSQVIRHAMELGALRHEQGFTEFEIFGAIVFAFMRRVADAVGGSPVEWAVCAQRLFLAVTTIQQATAMRYFEVMAARVRESEDRLRAFDRALTHEMRNRIGATLGAAELLESIDLVEADRRRLAGVVVRNARSMQVVLENLLELTHVASDARQHRRVPLPAAVAEAARQLRDAAATEGVEIRIDDALPPVEVSAAVVELSLVNFLSNAIKYRDPAHPAPFAHVTGRIEGDEVVVQVRDNGRGVPATVRDRLFDRFFRAQVEGGPEIDGTGLGLSIVREAIQRAGGRTWAEFPDDGGSVFGLALPARRVDDASAAGSLRAARS